MRNATTKNVKSDFGEVKGEKGEHRKGVYFFPLSSSSSL